MILRVFGCSDLLCASFPVCLAAVPEDDRVRARAAGRADEDALSLVPGSFEVGYVAEDGSAHRAALTDARAVRFEATAPSPVTGAIASSVSAISSSVAPAASAGRMSLSDIATGHGWADAGGMGERVMAGRGCPAEAAAVGTARGVPGLGPGDL